MKVAGMTLALSLLVVPWLLAQTKLVDAKWAIVRQLEARPSGLVRDTLLVVAYSDFVVELVNKEPPDSALIYVAKAYALAKSRSWQKGILLSFFKKASCLNIANRHYEAILAGIKGLKLAQEQQDIYFQGAFHRSLGNNYDMLDNYNEAIPNYEASLRLSENEPALQLIRARVLVELGDAYRLHRKQPARAKALIEEAIEIYRNKEPSGLGYAYDYYGQVLTDQRLFKEAHESFSRSHAYYKANEKEYLIPELLLHEAELYLAEKQYKQAIAKAKECLAYSQSKASLYGQKGAFRILYEANKALGRLNVALTYHEQFAAFADSLNGTFTSSRLQTVQDYIVQVRQETIDQVTIEQQRQMQQLLLGGLVILLAFSGYVFWNNRQLRQKNVAITAALLQGQTLERKRVAADLHDNLGTTLSALHWNLEAMDQTKLSAVEQSVYATIREQVKQAYTDVRLLSHNLLPDELAKQGLAVALQHLVDKLNRNTAIHFRFEAADSLTRLDHQTEFELYSICLELLNNIIKHAHATEGQIDLSQVTGNLNLNVSDNGSGHQGKQAEGLGMQNVAARVASLGGLWTVESTPGEGAQNKIVVPIRTPARVSSRT